MSIESQIKDGAVWITEGVIHSLQTAIQVLELGYDSALSGGYDAGVWAVNHPQVVLSIMVFLLTYVTWKDSTIDTRFDREQSIRSHIEGLKISKDSRYSLNKIELTISKVWVVEGFQFMYSLRRYGLRSGFKGHTRVHIDFEPEGCLDEITVAHYLVKCDIDTSKVMDVDVHDSFVKVWFSSAETDEIKRLVNDFATVLGKSAGQTVGESIGGGKLRPVLVEYCDTLFTRYESRSAFMAKVREIADSGRAIVRSRYKSLIFTPRAFFRVKTAYQESDTLDFGSGLSGFRQTLENLESVNETVNHISAGDSYEEPYPDDTGSYEVIEFEITPQREWDDSDFGTRVSTNTDGHLFLSRMPEYPEIEIEDTYSMKVPIKDFRATSHPDIDFTSHEADGPIQMVGNDGDPSKFTRHLRKNQDAVAITATGYSLNSYYELGDGMYLVVKWWPTGAKIWELSWRNPDFSIPLQGDTLWTR